jgi:RHS repeat-associated protein
LENRLISGPGAATLSYDPLGRLAQTAAAGVTTRFGYDGTELTGEYNAAGTLLRRYVHGPSDDDPLVWYEGSGTTDRRWLHADERGSIVGVSNSAGTSIAINAYDEYGIPASTNMGRFGYTGQTWLPEVGLYYYKARIYSPTLGRFMQTDPIGYGDGINWYDYVDGDPVNRSDPTGLKCKQCVTTEVITNQIWGRSLARHPVALPIMTKPGNSVERRDSGTTTSPPKPGKGFGEASTTASMLGASSTAAGQAFDGGGSLGKALKVAGGAGSVVSGVLTAGRLAAEGHSGKSVAAGTAAGVATGGYFALGGAVVGELIFPAGGGVPGALIGASIDGISGASDAMASHVAANPGSGPTGGPENMFSPIMFPPF